VIEIKTNVANVNNILPQNLKTVLQEIGELSALLFLYVEIAKRGITGWRVFRSYSDKGCDLILIGPSETQIKLEVKTRQTMTTNRDQDRVQFSITESEKDSSDFLLAYWFNKRTFFIVPMDKLTKIKSKNYTFSARYSKSDTDYTDSCRHYADDWERIFAIIDKKVE